MFFLEVLFLLFFSDQNLSTDPRTKKNYHVDLLLICNFKLIFTVIKEISSALGETWQQKWFPKKKKINRKKKKPTEKKTEKTLNTCKRQTWIISQQTLNTRIIWIVTEIVKIGTGKRHLQSALVSPFFLLFILLFELFIIHIMR